MKQVPWQEAIGLAIDTTFDDTSVAIIRGSRQVLTNKVLSQYKEHAEFGGVVPERASRKHLEVIHPLIDEALKEANLSLKELHYIAVSNYPGLLGSLLVGLTVAKSLAFALDLPLIGVNHVESHPYANVIDSGEFRFPMIHLVVAGGHTVLLHAKDHFDYRIIGRSIDDAAGECVDKVAKMFGYPMPGGPVVDRYAVEFPSDRYSFPKPLMHSGDFDFSFSGLKTAMLRFKEKNHEAIESDHQAVLSSFFSSIEEVLVSKTFAALNHCGVKSLSVSGGLAASKKLRSRFEAEARQRRIRLQYPPPKMCTDNAAMVACLAAHRYQRQQFDSLSLDAFANIAN